MCAIVHANRTASRTQVIIGKAFGIFHFAHSPSHLFSFAQLFTLRINWCWMQTKESITFSEWMHVSMLLSNCWWYYCCRCCCCCCYCWFYFIFVAPQTTETTTPNYIVLGCYKPVCFSFIHTHPSAVSSTKQILYDVCVPALFYYAAF